MTLYKTVFELFQKLHLLIYTSQFMASFYSTFIYLFEFIKCEKEGKNDKKIEYLENEKSFVDEINRIFHSF